MKGCRLALGGWGIGQDLLHYPLVYCIQALQTGSFTTLLRLFRSLFLILGFHRHSLHQTLFALLVVTGIAHNSALLRALTPPREPLFQHGSSGGLKNEERLRLTW